MSANTFGNPEIDVPKSINLAILALEITKEILSKEGTFLVKVFQGEGFSELFKEIRSFFKIVKIKKPRASWKNSREVYVLAIGRM